MHLGNIKSAKENLIMKKELLNGLTEDQIAKVKACDNAGDLLQLAKDEGVELNEEQLNAVTGGGCFTSTGQNDNHRKKEM